MSVRPLGIASDTLVLSTQLVNAKAPPSNLYNLQLFTHSLKKERKKSRKKEKGQRREGDSRKQGGTEENEREERKELAGAIGSAATVARRCCRRAHCRRVTAAMPSQMRREATEGEKIRGGERESALVRDVKVAFHRCAARGCRRRLKARHRHPRREPLLSLVEPRRPVLLPIGALAIAVNWGQNRCYVPRAVMEVADSDHYGGVEANKKLLELLLMSLILLLQFWAVFTFNTYSIWILYSAVTTIIIVELLPLLP
ncbi:uncharacterized protein DS421_14g471310 [Arachis hypogaea]|nr:uncharacterized protein DS421_14g471310 [Arachis hypogaea]